MHVEFDPIRMAQVERYCACKEDCCCGEKNEHEWHWDEQVANKRLQLSEGNFEVKFHPGFSTGTAAVRANRFMACGRHHYWEVKMITPVYGTDVMVGVGTSKVNLEEAKLVFCSLLGLNRESWGLSYKGYLQHGGETRNYAPPFGQGSLVGVHLDAWKGTVEFYLNRKPLGVAFTGLKGLELYPMLSSTAADSKIRITHSSSVPVSLQLDCLAVLKPSVRIVLASRFPGLRHLTQSIFADILQSTQDREEDEFTEDFTIFDEFDAALIGNKRRKKDEPRDTGNLSGVARCGCEICGTMTTAISTPPLCFICSCL